MGDFASHRLPEGGGIPDGHPATLANNRTVEHNHAIVRSWLPTWLREYIDDVERLEREVSGRALRIARWRLALSPSHRVIQSFQSPMWSYDTERWHPLPIDLQVAMGVDRPNVFPPDALQDISVLVEKPNAKELLGHELFIEASNQKGANPRSALIVGIAAAEAGIQEFITELEPSTAWLLENMPSPSLSDLLRKYLPQLLVEHGIRDLAKRPPGFVMNVLDDAVKLRSKVAHGIERPVTMDQVNATLVAIRDILWVLDVFRGYEWARHSVRDETLKAWDPEPPA